MVVGEGLAKNNDPLIQKAYQLGESEAKKQLNLFFEHAEIEKKRKENEGEPPATAKQASDALEAVKFLIYNRAATNGICAANALEVSSKLAAKDSMHECIEARNAAMEKFIKLGDYRTLPSDRSRNNCELLGRDFDNERRFPPFEFLKVGLGPPLFNFEVVNDCLMSDR